MRWGLDFGVEEERNRQVNNVFMVFTLRQRQTFNGNAPLFVSKCYICYVWGKTLEQSQISSVDLLLGKKAVWNVMLSDPTAARGHCNPPRMRLSLCGNSGPRWAGHSHQLCVWDRAHSTPTANLCQHTHLQTLHINSGRAVLQHQPSPRQFPLAPSPPDRDGLQVSRFPPPAAARRPVRRPPSKWWTIRFQRCRCVRPSTDGSKEVSLFSPAGPRRR